MRISIYNYKFVLILILILLISTKAKSQTDTLKEVGQQTISANTKLNMDAVYSRPFLTSSKSPIAIGGYIEANTQYSQTNGISDGFSFQARRMTLFLSSSISDNIKFLSEIEFEDGTKEINIEYAAIDMEFNPLLNLRAGIIMNPIGAFNQNHDSPRWDFIDRPLSATTILPATLSNVGFGLHGKYFSHFLTIGYEAYLTNGFDDKVISNISNRTSLAAGKSNPEKFEESNSGLPMFTGKLAFRNREIGELGISYLIGVYNKWKQDGIIIDDKRSASAFAIDFNTSQFDNKLNITGEIAKVIVDVPDSYSQQFGREQIGGYLDIIYTFYQNKIFNWDKAKISLGLRLEMNDYNQAKFKETNGNIADDMWAIVPSLSFRPVGSTVLRFNYRHQEQRDLLGNPATKTGVIQFGIATYF